MLLEVRDLTVRYGRVEALHGVSLGLDRGEAVAVLGPNGAGKTTLLRALSGLVRSASGTAVLDGEPLTGRAAYRNARAGFVHVPEGRGIVAPLTVRENLLMGAFALRDGSAAGRLDEMLDLFPALRRRLHLAAGLLSGGEQQMLAIARGLMADPKVLAIDEPSMGLAPVIVQDVLDAMRAAVRAGASVLLVEQNVALALELADRVYVLVNGSVEASGAEADLPRDLLATYVA